VIVIRIHIILVRSILVKITAMHMTRTAHSKELLYAYYHEHRDHGYQSGHGRILLVPEWRQTWVRKGYVRGREEMYKGRGYQNTGSEVPREEDEVVWYGEARIPADDDGKGTRCMYLLAHCPNGNST
jgi:hypothetical protein